jgi:hypothetical protein
VEFRLSDADIDVLTNRNNRLPPPLNTLWLCGLDDQWQGSPDASAVAAAQQVRAAPCS